MPHLIVETTRELAGSLDFGEVCATLHGALAATGHVRLDDLKSRLLVAEAALTGNTPADGFLVVHLLMTRPRPEPVQAELAALVLRHFEAAVRAAAPQGVVQVCVLHRAVAPGAYRKTLVSPA
ncbi:hypothetical protein BKK79_12865 [Cupriavidus sp. USMAA2-4]|uniref:5-carboxymethyl-2-hydroxymuconate isomerase n=1 Tax=Cupriavidus malaysiensis TaxID=367825 RepID=A0ABM6F836_9BURK|nr:MULTISPECIES: hypothetical protein [Cupriavidus]AOY92572.1 hypothetical protein BKK79_12865 [Cupriavidus sp. USMAA2-4]AOZ00984.1 hypothetical protein BKK81_18325 [Cupriavidus sp. USMAHM13]AOZ07714.1 hypothetical protein BKK80_19180 [Cupriavidus malaysiensis]